MSTASNTSWLQERRRYDSTLATSVGTACLSDQLRSPTRQCTDYVGCALTWTVEVTTCAKRYSGGLKALETKLCELDKPKTRRSVRVMAGWVWRVLAKMGWVWRVLATMGWVWRVLAEMGWVLAGMCGYGGICLSLVSISTPSPSDWFSTPSHLRQSSHHFTRRTSDPIRTVSIPCQIPLFIFSAPRYRPPQDIFHPSSLFGVIRISVNFERA